MPHTEKMRTKACDAGAATRSWARSEMKLHDDLRCDQNARGPVAAVKPSSSSGMYLLSCVCGVSVVSDVELTSMRTLAVIRGVSK